MAKKSVRLRNEKRIEMSKRQFTIRKELREKLLNPRSTEEEKAAARQTLQGLRRNASATRVKTRCILTGRARGVYRKFGLCRNKFRELALKGQIPGVTKASW